MNFIEELRWRGMIHDIMPGTEEALLKIHLPVISVLTRPRTLYILEVWFKS